VYGWNGISLSDASEVPGDEDEQGRALVLGGTLAASGRSLPTILMTANDDEATQKIARNAGVLATLYNPFDADVLLATIARACWLSSKTTQSGLTPGGRRVKHDR
jgi:DNA-binding response OmpR family regulator